MRLILVRHGETSWNQEGRIQGCRSDTELSERGKEQIRKVAQALRGQSITAIYSSPLRRAMDTAKAIAQALGLEVKVIPELRELDIGELEGLVEKELKGRYREFWEKWRGGNPSLHMPGGESLEELQRRAWQAIECIVGEHPDEVVAVTSHLFTNLTIICQALGLDLRYMRRLRQNVTAIDILDLTRQRNSLLLLNDTCHLGA
ncbi:MAG TPA: histidine phosphatase family protein [Dehalococcoidia bacterium]|nr:histidine phosphatase family protein [Dehalococcoidia bacterium]